MTDLASRLKALTDKGLEEPDDFPVALPDFTQGTPEILPAAPAPPLADINYQTIFEEYNNLIQKSEPRYKILILNEGWRCNHEFLHNGRVCNTINGHVKNQKPTIRTTCMKCKQKRKNPKTFIEEFNEFSGWQIDQRNEREELLKPIPITEDTFPEEESDDY